MSCATGRHSWSSWPSLLFWISFHCPNDGLNPPQESCTISLARAVGRHSRAGTAAEAQRGWLSAMARGHYRTEFHAGPLKVQQRSGSATLAKLGEIKLKHVPLLNTANSSALIRKQKEVLNLMMRTFLLDTYGLTWAQFVKGFGCGGLFVWLLMRSDQPWRTGLPPRRSDSNMLFSSAVSFGACSFNAASARDLAAAMNRSVLSPESKAKLSQQHPPKVWID